MIDITSEVNKIVGEGEGLHLEYKAVLPPSRNIAQLICAFANTEGGFIILGILEKPNGQIEISGLSEDFRAKSITHKAIDLLTPKPQVVYQYVSHDSKKLYAIKINKSDEVISLEGKIYIRVELADFILIRPFSLSPSSAGFLSLTKAPSLIYIFPSKEITSSDLLIFMA
jgi:predicted HTH transcriptional regulator